MKVLLIGGSGFIGSHLCDLLLREGHEVRVYSRGLEKYRQPLAEVEYILGDFADQFALSEALIGVDCVVHLVSSTVPGTSNIDPAADIATNLVPTVNLLDLMRQTGPSRLVFLSSGGTVYGDPESLPVSEDHPLRPTCSYAVVKIAIEQYLSMYMNLYGIQSIVLRASNPYGPRQGRLNVQGLIATFLSRMLDGKPLEIWGDGEIVRDYFYVSDLAELCLRAVESEATGIYNAGSGVGTSINEVLDLVGEVTGIDPEVRKVASRKFDIGRIYLDIEAACDTFSWQPEVALHDGISRHWQWLKER